MAFKKFRWSKVYESSEEELIDFLQSRGLKGQRTHLDAQSQQADLKAVVDTTIWCAEGSFVIKIGETSYSMQPGDALAIAENTAYLVQPGMFDGAYYLTS